MSCEHLSEEIDIHGGGLDLVFPHHENEIAQSEAASGKPFSRIWMHNGLLTMQSGQKMGKSLGNVINIHDALDQFPAEAIRLYLLQHHYRTALPWSDTALVESLAMLARLYEAKEVALQMGGEEDADRVAESLGADAQSALELARTFSDRLYAHLDDDFNTANALALDANPAAVGTVFSERTANRGPPPATSRASSTNAATRAVSSSRAGSPSRMSETSSAGSSHVVVWKRSSVRLNDPTAGRLSPTSRLPQYFTRAMLVWARAATMRTTTFKRWWVPTR